MNSNALDFLKNLPQNGKVIAEYIWIDGAFGLRSKTRTLDKKPTSIKEIPNWNYDGSSCYQAPTNNSEIIIKPVAFFPDPFRGGDNILVLTETFIWEDTTYSKLIPSSTNTRAYVKPIFDAAEKEKSWWGIEQEYTILAERNRFTVAPYGWPKGGNPAAQGPYYCSVGGNVAFGRGIADAHYKACLYAGLKISGTNAEVMPGQWEYQIGPCEGIDAGDHMWVSRFLLHRVAEEYKLAISFEPKLFPDWNGSGCHTNFSTETMRVGSGGMKYIDDMMKKFEAKHLLHMNLYGEDNEKRLTGHHETSSWRQFSYGVGNRGCSFRIPTQTKHDNGAGYIEDRRPASNIDPYAVTGIILDTACLENSLAQPLIDNYAKWVKFIKENPVERM